MGTRKKGRRLIKSTKGDARKVRKNTSCHFKANSRGRSTFHLGLEQKGCEYNNESNGVFNFHKKEALE